MNDHISKLSDTMLVEKLVNLAKGELEVTAEILLHLVEFDKRRLYRDQGYPSLFSYCVHGLGYSETAAKRRMTAARCIRDFPEVYEMFLKGEVSLTSISIFAPIITEGNKQAVLAQVASKPTAEVEWIAGRYNPRKLTWDRIIPIVVRRLPELTNAQSNEPNNLELDLGPQRTRMEIAGNSAQSTTLEECYRFEFSTSKTFKDKLDKVKTLVSGKLVPGASLEKVMELLIDDYIDRHSPEKREERRKARKEKQAQVSYTPWRLRDRGSNHRRRIPSQTRDEVFVRDGFKCTYVSDDGVRCNATTGLHLDHNLCDASHKLCYVE